MPQINVSDSTYARLQAFRPLGERLGEEQITLDTCAESLILFGISAILDRLWKPHDAETLVQALQTLADRHPDQVFNFLTDVLKTGDDVEQKKPFGFAAARRAAPSLSRPEIRSGQA
jgi:hypothetical protein